MTDLRVNGVDPIYPRGGVNIYAEAKGPIFVNPAYFSTTRPIGRASLRAGTIMNGGIVCEDRPIWLRARMPQLSSTRGMEMRINHRFGETGVAKTQDEAIVYLFVPKMYKGDWEHFMGVCTHLYLDGSPGFGAVKARALVTEAMRGDAPLMDISYCWEGIGEEAAEVIRPLYANASPELAFAAARAGAFIGDSAAEQALLDMAKAGGHAFQLNAVKTLGALPESPRIIRMLESLLSADNALVRAEAYQILVASERGSAMIVSREAGGLFAVDHVFCEGPPLVFARRSGEPRIAFFGKTIPLNVPIMFEGMGGRFTISSNSDARTVTLFDRTLDPRGVQARMPPDLTEVCWRLTGGGEERFSFCYSDLVGLLQGLADGRQMHAPFVLQEAADMQEAIEEAPRITEPAARPAFSPPLDVAKP